MTPGSDGAVAMAMSTPAPRPERRAPTRPWSAAPVAVDAVAGALAQPDALRVHFQPIVDLARGVVAGYEALSRFAGPPQLTPDVWFRAAHDHGLGAELEARAREEARLTDAGERGVHAG